VVLPTREDATTTLNEADREKAAREVAKGIFTTLHNRKHQVPDNEDKLSGMSREGGRISAPGGSPSASQELPKDARGRGNDKPAGWTHVALRWKGKALSAREKNGKHQMMILHDRELGARRLHRRGR